MSKGVILSPKGVILSLSKGVILSLSKGVILSLSKDGPGQRHADVGLVDAVATLQGVAQGLELIVDG